VTAGSANSRRLHAIRGPAWWWGPVAIYAAAIFIASSIPQPPSLPQIVTDKGLHGGLYGGFALVILRALAKRWDRVTPLTAAAAIVAAVVYGISDEFHQSFVPGRTSDAADVLADAIGATVAVGIAWAIARLGRRGTGARI
jgi:VanZ family protein